MAQIDPAILLQLLTGMAGDSNAPVNVGTVRNPVMKAGGPQFTAQDLANITRPGGTVMNPNTPTLRPASPESLMSMQPQVSEMNQSVQPTGAPVEEASPEPVQATSAGPAKKQLTAPKLSVADAGKASRLLQKLGLEDVPVDVDTEADPRLQALRGKKGDLAKSRADLLERADKPTDTGDLIGQALVGLLPGLLGLGIGGAVAGTHGAAAGAAGGFGGAAEGLGKLQQTKRDDKAKLVARAEQLGDREQQIEGMEGHRTDTLEGRSLAGQEAARGRNQRAGEFNAGAENSAIAQDKANEFTAKQNAIAGARSDRHLAATLGQRDRESAREALAKLEAANKGKTFTDGQKSFYSNVDSGLKLIQKMRETISGKDGKPGAGNSESDWFGDAEAAAKLGSLPYLISVHVAKILDPTTAAREGEVEAGRKFLVQAGILTPNGVTLQGLKTVEEMIRAKAQEMNTAFNDPIPEIARGAAPKAEAASPNASYQQYRASK
jgi:hypothetical protein